MSNSKPEFTVIDKRGQNHTTTETVIAPTPQSEEARKSKSIWENVAFMVVLLQGNQGLTVSGRAVGLRQDQQLAVADYFLPPIWPEHLDWTKHARRRLNTFLGCYCSGSVPCAYHRNAIQEWVAEDLKRVNSAGNNNLPKAVEILMRAEKSRSNIVVPR